jgi:hypothetical protein
MAAKPPARYGAIKGARAGGFAISELHHYYGRDRSGAIHEYDAVPLGVSSRPQLQVVY